MKDLHQVGAKNHAKSFKLSSTVSLAASAVNRGLRAGKGVSPRG